MRLSWNRKGGEYPPFDWPMLAAAIPEGRAHAARGHPDDPVDPSR